MGDREKVRRNNGRIVKCRKETVGKFRGEKGRKGTVGIESQLEEQ